MAIENIISTILCFSKHALGPRTLKKDKVLGEKERKMALRTAGCLVLA